MKKKEEMKRGDHIYVNTRIPTITHHGVYWGDSYVIHFDGHTKKVVKSSLDAFSNPFNVSQIKVFNYNPAELSLKSAFEYSYFGNPFIGNPLFNHTLSDVDTVITRAESMLGKSNYDFGKRNCEHFVVWCKTGRWSSYQIETKITNVIFHLVRISVSSIPFPYNLITGTIMAILIIPIYFLSLLFWRGKAPKD